MPRPLLLYALLLQGSDALPGPRPPTARQACSSRSFSRHQSLWTHPSSRLFSRLTRWRRHPPWWYSSLRATSFFFLAQSVCQQRAAPGARSHHGHDKSRRQSRSRSRSSHRLTRHFHCQQQQKITIVGAPSHSIMPSRCCRLPCRLNSRCPSETAGQGCPLLRQLPRATRATTMGTTPTTVRRPQCATHSMASAH